MTSRQRTVAALLTVLVVTSGCIGFLTGEEAITVEAEKAVTDQAVAEDGGYELNQSETIAIERNLTFAGVTRQVRVTNWVTTYDKAVEIPLFGRLRLGMFGVISTPAVEIAGEPRNPIGDYDNDQLVALFESRYQQISDVERVSSRQLTVLGKETTVTKYAATTTIQGQEVDVYVHVTKLQHESDFIVALGIYPRQLDGEQDNVLEMMRAIEHPA